MGGRFSPFQFETLLTPGNEGTVHHMTLYGCYNDSQTSIGKSVGDQWNCYDEATNMPAMQCTSAIFGWAIGEEVCRKPYYVRKTDNINLSCQYMVKKYSSESLDFSWKNAVVLVRQCNFRDSVEILTRTRLV